jgi:hypothetical protein
MTDYAYRLSLYQNERNEMEIRFSQQACELASQPVDKRFQFSEACFTEVRHATQRWTKTVRNSSYRKPASWLFRSTWKRLNHQAGIPD